MANRKTCGVVDCDEAPTRHDVPVCRDHWNGLPQQLRTRWTEPPYMRVGDFLVEVNEFYAAQQPGAVSA